MRSARTKAAVWVVFALFALTCAGSGCEESIPGLGVNLKLEKRSLGNGLVVIFVEDHTVPVVSYQTWYRVGSVDEHPGITGISHLFEHLMFKGTAKYGAKAFFRELEAKGAEVNAYTTRDYTVYYENFAPALLPKTIDMEADRMANLKVDENDLNNERIVVFEERKLRNDNSPEGRIQEALWELSFRVHPYQWPVIGYPQDLLTITTQQVSDYFRAHYQPANAAVVVVGDFDSSKTYDAIRAAYEKIPSAPRPRRQIEAEPQQDGERRLVLHDHVASERFAQAYPISAADNGDSYALDVLANILFEGTSSRAYHRLVDQLDLVTDVGGSSYTPTYPGLFIITGTMSQGRHAAEAEGELGKLIREVQESGVTDDEVHVAVRQLTVQLIDSVRTPFGLGQLIGTVQTVFGDPTRFASDLAKYTRVRADDVKRVAQKYLVPNNRSVVTLMPSARKEGEHR